MCAFNAVGIEAITPNATTFRFVPKGPRYSVLNSLLSEESKNQTERMQVRKKEGRKSENDTWLPECCSRALYPYLGVVA